MSEQVTLTVDGQEVTINSGATIYWAAKKLGIEIPHLCYGEDLPAMSSCRLCVVEVEGMRALAASCSHPVSNGMVVHTNTERAKRARKLNLELLLSDHKVECIVCEKSGDCLLEKYAYEFGVREPSFGGGKNEHAIRDDDPFIVRDYGKCIQCGRCVYVCGQIQYDGAINIADRGFGARISTPFERPLQETTCVSCGRCISACPVGALTEKNRIGKGREWELTKVNTICPYCGCGCTLEVNTKDGEIVKVTTPKDKTVNSGNLCVKGKFGLSFVGHSDRLKTPLVKRDGKFEQASWDEALRYTAENLTRIKNESGPDAIAGLSSAKCTNEDNYIFQKFIRAGIGSNNVDHCARLCHSSTVAGLARAFGSGAMTNAMKELRQADCILVTGSNTTEAHPIIALDIKAAVEQHGAKLIVADPRRIDLVRFSTVWLRQQSGTDVALFNGLMHVILSENLADMEYVKQRTENFEHFRETIMQYPPEKVEEITGVPKEQIAEAARIYARAGAASIVYSMGITQHTTGTDNVLSLANLAMLTGNVGKKSAGVNPLRGQNNVQGACDLGALPNVYPGYQKVDDLQVQKKFETAWGTALSPKPGKTVVEMLHGVEDGSIRAMYIMGENPSLSDPNVNRVRQNLQALDFLVVQDIFLSDTAEFADVVLPAVCFAEKDGTFTNTERRVQLLRQVVPPPGNGEGRLGHRLRRVVQDGIPHGIHLLGRYHG